MRIVKRVPLIALISGACLALATLGAAAQEPEEYLGPDADEPLAGYTRNDGTVVLTNESYCRYILGTVVGEERLTYVELLDKTKKQKQARRAAFSATDESAVTRCVDVLTASRAEAPEADLVAAWAGASAVVPESMAVLLPDDFVAEPLAQPDPVVAASRTSGYGDLVSAPFSVSPGPWLAELDATACERWEGTLRDAQEPERAFPLIDSREYLYGLTAGHYYWDVSASDCDWSVDMVPVVLGPEPTPTPEPQAVVPRLYGTGWDRSIGAENPDHLTAPQAREAVLEAGLVPGTCHTSLEGSRTKEKVWQQDPPAGTLVDFYTPVDIWVGRDCDVYEGTRVVE